MTSAKDRYFEAKRKRDEKEEAKRIADEIGLIIGFSPTAPRTPFPGLQEANEEVTRLLDEWAEEEKNK